MILYESKIKIKIKIKKLFLKLIILTINDFIILLISDFLN